MSSPVDETPKSKNAFPRNGWFAGGVGSGAGYWTPQDGMTFEEWQRTRIAGVALDALIQKDSGQLGSNVLVQCKLAVQYADTLIKLLEKE